MKSRRKILHNLRKTVSSYTYNKFYYLELNLMELILKCILTTYII